MEKWIDEVEVEGEKSWSQKATVLEAGVKAMHYMQALCFCTSDP